MTTTRHPHTQRCRKLFVNSDHVISCIAPFADDITDEKCIEGKGECEFREVKATHTSPPAPETRREYLTKQSIEQIKAMAAKAAREQVLKDLISKFDDMNDERFMDYMESLRAQQEEQG
jgi:hypothetical protein